MTVISAVLNIALLWSNAYGSFKTLKQVPLSSRGQPKSKLVQARKRDMKTSLAVWVVWVFWTLLERILDATVGVILPFYYEIKCLVLIIFLLSRPWCAEPIVLHVIRPFIRPYTTAIDFSLHWIALLGDFLLLVICLPYHSLSWRWHQPATEEKITEGHTDEEPLDKLQVPGTLPILPANNEPITTNDTPNPNPVQINKPVPISQEVDGGIFPKQTRNEKSLPPPQPQPPLPSIPATISKTDPERVSQMRQTVREANAVYKQIDDAQQRVRDYAAQKDRIGTRRRGPGLGNLNSTDKPAAPSVIYNQQPSLSRSRSSSDKLSYAQRPAEETQDFSKLHAPRHISHNVSSQSLPRPQTQRPKAARSNSPPSSYILRNTETRTNDGYYSSTNSSIYPTLPVPPAPVNPIANRGLSTTFSFPDSAFVNQGSTEVAKNSLRHPPAAESRTLRAATAALTSSSSKPPTNFPRNKPPDIRRRPSLVEQPSEAARKQQQDEEQGFLVVLERPVLAALPLHGSGGTTNHQDNAVQEMGFVAADDVMLGGDARHQAERPTVRRSTRNTAAPTRSVTVDPAPKKQGGGKLTTEMVESSSEGTGSNSLDRPLRSAVRKHVATKTPQLASKPNKPATVNGKKRKAAVNLPGESRRDDNLLDNTGTLNTSQHAGKRRRLDLNEEKKTAVLVEGPGIARLQRANSLRSNRSISGKAGASWSTASSTTMVSLESAGTGAITRRTSSRKR